MKPKDDFPYQDTTGMDAIHKMNEDILKITSRIATEYPELTKYIVEMPVKNGEVFDKRITLQDLRNYHTSLETLLENYGKGHRAEVS